MQNQYNATVARIGQVEDAITAKTAKTAEDVAKSAAKIQEAFNPVGDKGGLRLLEGAGSDRRIEALITKGKDALLMLDAEALKATQDTTTAIVREWQKQEIEFEKLAKDGAITSTQLEAARVQMAEAAGHKINEERKKEFAQVQSDLTAIGQSIESSFTSAFHTITTGGTISFQQFTQSVLANLSEILFKLLVIKPIFDSIFGTSSQSGLLGPLLGGPTVTPKASDGGLFNALGGLFGGGRAAGGSVYPGMTYRVNENGQEFFSPSSSGSVVPANGGSGTSGQSIVYNIDAKGADIGASDRIGAVLSRMRPPEPVGAVRTQARRFPLRPMR